MTYAAEYLDPRSGVLPAQSWTPKPQIEPRQLKALPQTQRALLVWMGVGARLRRAVGVLQRQRDGIHFSYTTDSDDFQLARSEGFGGYPGLPIDREPGAQAFQHFERRLPFGRSDFGKLLQTFGLGELGAGSDRFSILTFMGARIARDSFGLLETFEGFAPPFSYIFDVAGFRHYFDKVSNLPTAGQNLRLVREPSNEYDPYAVRVEMEDGNLLGRIPSSQSRQVSAWLSAQRPPVAFLHRFGGRPSYPRCFLWVDFR